jgi:hypothetical protein
VVDQANDGPVAVRQQVDLHGRRPGRDAKAGCLPSQVDEGQMLARLKGFADTGKPMPYFDF